MDKSDYSTEKGALTLIEKMLRLMEERGLEELEIEQSGLRIRLKKQGAAPVIQTVESVPQAKLEPAAEAKKAAKEEPDRSDLVSITSPMVGTFYRSPAPDAPPFAEVGAEISEGQVVCIIEAMKLMNEIKSEVKGKIVEVAVKNGDPVEFGQPLFYVQPA